MLLLLAINYPRCCSYRPLIIAGVADTGDKLIAGVMKSMKVRDKGCQMSPVIIYHWYKHRQR
jgi:hypothetical protein